MTPEAPNKRERPMPTKTRKVRPGPRPNTVITEGGELLEAPQDWGLLAPGDAALTRKVKQAGPSWTVQQKKGRRTFSQGVWAPQAHIDEARAAVNAMREDPSYQKRRVREQERRQKREENYAVEFEQEILAYLAFVPRYEDLAKALAQAVSTHATPVGSGTVARTKRIPIAQRAEAAVIAWMRHSTSAYDHISVPRRKGARRELRRKIAERSRRILQQYRKEQDFDLAQCPLYRALQDEI